MSSFLVLHGIENHRPPGHWQFWLAGELAERGHQVLYPGLPDPDSPGYDLWAAALRTHLGELEAGERIVVCHSLACLLWLRSAEDLAEVSGQPDRLLLVSPPDSARLPDAGASFRLDRLDADAIRSSVRGEIRVVGSDSDPYNPTGATAMYAEPLGIPGDVIPGAGHITPDDGYGPWPSVLEWCVDGRRPVGPAR